MLLSMMPFKNSFYFYWYYMEIARRYLTTLLNSLIHLNNLSKDSFEFFPYTFILSVTNGNLLFFFPILTNFNCFSCFIAVARTFSTMSRKWCYEASMYHFQGQWEDFLHFTTKNIGYMRFVYIFYQIKEIVFCS